MRTYAVERVALFSAFCVLLALSSCAKDAVKGTVDAVQQVRITATFDSVKPEFFYFFVFSFTAVTNPTATSRPQHIISGRRRGENWDMYVVYHHFGSAVGPATWQTLWKRPGDTQFWVDELPQPLIQQLFYIDAQPSADAQGGGNRLSITLDPLELVAPDNSVPTKFLLDIMTADRGIDKQLNPLDQGVIYDYLDDPLIVTITPGVRLTETDLRIEYNDESSNLPAGMDLKDWTVDVT